MKRSAAVLLALLLVEQCHSFAPYSSNVVRTLHSKCPAFVQAGPRLASTSLAMLERRDFLSIIPLLFAPDYENRAAEFGIASKDQVKRVASRPNAVFLDVRSDEEIAEVTLHTKKPVVFSKCTISECPVLEVDAEKLLPHKNAPVIVFCASGKRARKGKEVLNAKGYRTVVNAGAIGDIDYLNE